jgi:uncharacterized membrane protein
VIAALPQQVQAGHNKKKRNKIETKREADMIRTPPGWGLELLGRTFQVRAAHTTHWVPAAAPPAIRRIGLEDLGQALRLGWQDFVSVRTDVVFLCLLYPIVGLVLARIAFGHDMLPLLFPLASGFALLGPLFGVGLNELSRRREAGQSAGWGDAFGVIHAPSFGAILLLGIVLTMMFIFWLILSQVLYVVTLGPEPPLSASAFLHDILTTGLGWTMMIVGTGIGFIIAASAFCISVVSFPLLLDQSVSLETAIRTSLQAVWQNLFVMTVWAALIAGSLVLALVPAMLGLIIVLPVLGHATWHLYRRMVRA